ncbi:MAG: hypothetical protein KME29_13290 [Calothrix sp. FI2-JRJ7]|nr:hypothetical protein [Calothrix sp. FI2-JRJ7]
MRTGRYIFDRRHRRFRVSARADATLKLFDNDCDIHTREGHNLFFVSFLVQQLSSAEGEIALNSFYLAQRPAADYALINISSILSSLKSGNPQDIDKMTQAISIGYQKGKNANPLIGIKCEDMWDKQLSEVINDLI